MVRLSDSTAMLLAVILFLVWQRNTQEFPGLNDLPSVLWPVSSVGQRMAKSSVVHQWLRSSDPVSD